VIQLAVFRGAQVMNLPFMEFWFIHTLLISWALFSR